MGEVDSPDQESQPCVIYDVSMWEFAGTHPVWFFIYLSTFCLTVSVVASALLSTVVKLTVADVIKKPHSIEESSNSGPVVSDSDVRVGKRTVTASKVPPIH